MEINKLFIFSKDTDAYSAQRGYNYQTLKTLETWVDNYLDNIDDDIYCEFEEDIFQKNNFFKKAKFRQIKLYSSNFSFKSIEVQKCLFHFFILHVKSDYNDFNKEFIFETNTNIANEYNGNDGEILKNWYENQNNISPEQLKLYSNKTRDIVSNFINSSLTGFRKTFSDEIITETKKIFENLDDNFWLNFTKLIKWKFIGVRPDIEYSNIKERIESQILKLPFSEVINDRLQKFYGVLLEKIFTISVNQDADERKLTKSLLEKQYLK